MHVAIDPTTGKRPITGGVRRMLARMAARVVAEQADDAGVALSDEARADLEGRALSLAERIYQRHPDESAVSPMTAAHSWAADGVRRALQVEQRGGVAAG